MIEFTMSRVALVVCGAAILAAVIVPVQSYYDGQYDASMGESADRLSMVLDTFWASEADTLIIRGWEVLPSADCSVVIEGHSLVLYSGDKAYRSSVSNSMERVVIGHGDEVRMTKK